MWYTAWIYQFNEKMTKEEYQKLLKDTFSYNQLDSVEQAKIMIAEGEEMEAYAKMFEQENETMKKAISDFNESSEQVIVDFKASLKKDEQSKLIASEKADKNKEEQTLNKLLNKI